MLQETYVPLLHTKNMASICIIYLLLHDRQGQEGKITALTFFIFICASVIALSSPYVPKKQLPCSVGTADCDVGVNLSATHLLFSEIILI